MLHATAVLMLHTFYSCFQPSRHTHDAPAASTALPTAIVNCNRRPANPGRAADSAFPQAPYQPPRELVSALQSLQNVTRELPVEADRLSIRSSDSSTWPLGMESDFTRLKAPTASTPRRIDVLIEDAALSRLQHVMAAVGADGSSVPRRDAEADLHDRRTAPFANYPLRPQAVFTLRSAAAFS